MKHALFAALLVLAGALAAAADGPDAPTAPTVDDLVARYRAVEGRRDDASYETQRQAVDALGEMATADARTSLRRLLTEEGRGGEGGKLPLGMDARRVTMILAALVARGGPEEIDLAVKTAESSRGAAVLEALPRILARATRDDTRAHLRGDALSRATPPVKAQIARALGAMGDPAATVPLLASLRADDPAVRAEALFALGQLGDEAALAPMTVFLRHDDPRIREVAARALGALKNARAVGPLVRALEDPVPLVVESAATALSVLDDRAAVGPLIERLAAAEGKDLRLVEALLSALERLTGMVLGEDAALWRGWWAVAKDHPTQAGQKPEKPTTVSGPRYYGFAVRSSRVVFVLDVSRSMSWNDRLVTAKAELKQVLEHLPAATRFNLVTFSDTAGWWAESLTPATPANVQRAVRFVLRQEPVNGTNAYDGLRLALKDEAVDTVFFLSDGSPSSGQVVDPDELLAQVREMNRWRRVRIHTVALLKGEPPPALASLEDGAAAASFMRRLAEENGGKFKDVR